MIAVPKTVATSVLENKLEYVAYINASIPKECMENFASSSCNGKVI
jgi:hypothetical protein